jgi:hypothetical protein
MEEEERGECTLPTWRGVWRQYVQKEYKRTWEILDDRKIQVRINNRFEVVVEEVR